VRDTHLLWSAEGKTTREIKRTRETHPLLSTKGGGQVRTPKESKREQRALTSCQIQREGQLEVMMPRESKRVRGTHSLSRAEEGQVRMPRETERVRGTYELSCRGRDNSGHQEKLRAQWALTCCQVQRKDTKKSERVRALMNCQAQRN